MISRKLLILGCGGHGKVVTEVAEALGYANISYLDRPGSSAREFMGRGILGAEPEDYDDYFFVALGDNAKRERAYNAFCQKNPRAVAVSLVHPSSVVSPRALIGPGSIVMPLCVVNSSTTLGKGVIINTKASVDHDNFLMDFSSCAPGVSLGGNVTVGLRSAISIGASVKHGISIGNDVVVGASSFVSCDVRDCVVAYGVPAKFVRDRKVGEPYLE